MGRGNGRRNGYKVVHFYWEAGVVLDSISRSLHPSSPLGLPPRFSKLRVRWARSPLLLGLGLHHELRDWIAEALDSEEWSLAWSSWCRPWFSDDDLLEVEKIWPRYRGVGITSPWIVFLRFLTTEMLSQSSRLGRITCTFLLQWSHEGSSAYDRGQCTH